MVNLVVTQGIPTNVLAMEALYVVVMTLGKQLGAVIMDWGTHSVVIIAVIFVVVVKYVPTIPSKSAIVLGNVPHTDVVMRTDIVILVGWKQIIGDTTKRFTTDKVVDVVVITPSEPRNAQATMMD